MSRSTIDEVGLSTLEHLSDVDQLNDWMFESIKPYIKGSVLEIGSGIGNISSRLIQRGIPLCVSDYSDYYCDLLKKKFADERLIKDVFQLDLAEPDLQSTCPALIGRFDTVFALNVVEHIKDDGLAIANARRLLKAGGQLIVLVPAFQILYNSFDKELEHFRRYTRTSAKKLFRAQGLEVMTSWYFNLAGILGWFVSGTLLGKKELPARQLTLYNKLVPLFRFADRLTFNSAGLSVIIVGKKLPS